jgi:hypothetical protein
MKNKINISDTNFEDRESTVKIISISTYHQWDGETMSLTEYNDLLDSLINGKFYFIAKIEINGKPHIQSNIEKKIGISILKKRNNNEK